MTAVTGDSPPNPRCGVQLDSARLLLTQQRYRHSLPFVCIRKAIATAYCAWPTTLLQSRQRIKDLRFSKLMRYMLRLVQDTFCNRAWRAHPLKVEQGQHFIWLTYSVQVVKAKRDQRLIDKASKIGRNDERSP